MQADNALSVKRQNFAEVIYVIIAHGKTVLKRRLNLFTAENNSESVDVLTHSNTGTPGTVSFHFGAFCFDVRQFGAFQFGAFHFDAVPVRRVSLWRASTSARFTLARFPILYESTVIRYLRTPVSRVSRGLFVCMFLFCGEELSTSFCAHVSFRSSVVVDTVSILRACFLSANKCFLR